MIGASIRETMGETETVVTEFYDDVAEPKIHKKYFKCLGWNQSEDEENLASFRIGYIRLNHHVREKTSIMVDQDRKESPGEDEVKTHAEVK